MKRYYITQPIYDIDLVSPVEGRIGYEYWMESREIQGVSGPVYGFVEYGKALPEEEIKKYDFAVSKNKGEIER